MTDLWVPISGVFWRTAPLFPDLGWSVDFGALFTTIVGALAGAGIGAWAAGYISERNKFREQLTKEIRDTNAAIVLALGVMNLGAGLKRQHVKALVEDYVEQRAKCHEEVAKMKAGGTQSEVPKINFLELQEIAPPVIHLQEIVLSRISTAGRALAAVTALTDAVINLNCSLKRRNELIKQFKKDDFPVGARKEHFCFGLPYGDGVTNEEYGDSIKGISSYTNDVIFFSSELCADLHEHAELIVEQFRSRRLGGKTPNVNRIDLTEARKAGLIPSAEGYESWTSGFKKAPKEQKRRWRFWPHKQTPPGS
ncbi:hypothetical protein HX788_10465 [Pseudomonas edaphica]|uniref:Uncharacterized protein n=1 Tax=Pseudomonas edaphica TaxID=2006980 RepID=A0A7Y8FSP2_9PSED|nr:MULTISPECIES: hypothetical protein [Pseudomonas]NWC47859.1 hypothetical protein [Pseudomonas sp. IPO3747]NWE07516.1 hypothetical protein [Pseudomonas edaphica]NWE84812.1 hypothetical protein [Pseudomonas edaphica]